jgi:hypothetical protein
MSTTSIREIEFKKLGEIKRVLEDCYRAVLIL